MYFLRSENKSADQLWSYCTGDKRLITCAVSAQLRLCFRVFVFAYTECWFSDAAAHQGDVVKKFAFCDFSPYDKKQDSTQVLEMLDLWWDGFNI